MKPRNRTIEKVLRNYSHVQSKISMKSSPSLALATILCAITLSGLLTAAHSQQPSSLEVVPYPEGYREWAHVSSAIITPQSPAFKRFGGFHHIYANAKAMEGYRSGTFADGSVIVFDLLEAQEKDGAISEGGRRFVDVMLKDSKRFAQTGGWGFEEFRGDSKTERTLSNPQEQCFQCHAKKQERGFVYSVLRK